MLGIPVRYAHTHYVYSAAADVDAAIALACAILRALTPDVLRLLNPIDVYKRQPFRRYP